MTIPTVQAYYRRAHRSAPSGHQTMAWARRRTSLPRSSRSASMGRPGSDSSAREEPLDRLRLVEPVVGEHDERAAQALDDGAVPAGTPPAHRPRRSGSDERELPLAGQLTHPVRADAELVARLLEGQPGGDEGGEVGGHDVPGHGSSVPRRRGRSPHVSVLTGPGEADRSLTARSVDSAAWTRSATTDPLVGQLLDGRYRVGERIARGGMATVYEATDLRLDRVVAIKVMPHCARRRPELQPAVRPRGPGGGPAWHTRTSWPSTTRATTTARCSSRWSTSPDVIPCAT